MTDEESTSDLTIETTVPTGVLPDDQARNYARHILANRDPSRPGTVQLAEKVLDLLDRLQQLTGDGRDDLTADELHVCVAQYDWLTARTAHGRVDPDALLWAKRLQRAVHEIVRHRGGR